jgi:levanase/fructan beta-fructosidase
MDWSDYGIGTFDGHRFEMQGKKRRLDEGNAYSANQTWWDASEKDGRRIQIAWLRSGKPVAGAPFDQQLSFPCQLSLQRQPDGIRLCRYPIPEISRLQSGETVEKAKSLLATKSISSPVENDTLDISLDIQPQEGGAFSLLVRGIAIDYSVRSQQLSFLGNTAALPLMPDGHLRLRILVDRLSVEVFGNNGLVSMTSYAELDPKMRSVSLRSYQGDHLIHELRVAKIESVWKRMNASKPR